MSRTFARVPFRAFLQQLLLEIEHADVEQQLRQQYGYAQYIASNKLAEGLEQTHLLGMAEIELRFWVEQRRPRWWQHPWVDIAAYFRKPPSGLMALAPTGDRTAFEVTVKVKRTEHGEWQVRSEPSLTSLEKCYVSDIFA
jgi:hypothetical protein